MAAARGSYGILKRAWNEIPEIVGSTVLALGGIGLACAGLVIYEAKGGDKARIHKFEYIVLRPDDPRVKELCS